MTASFPPIKKSLYRIITVISIICLLVISCTIPASAYSNEQFPNDNWFPRVNLPCSRPEVDDRCMYIEVLTKKGTEFYVDLIVFELQFWFRDDSYDLDNFHCHPIFVGTNLFNIEFFVPTDSDLSWNIYSYNSLDGKLSYIDSDILYSSDAEGNVTPQLLTFHYPYTVYGVHYYGIDCITEESIPPFQVEFVVTYASEGLLLNYLDYLKNAITNFHSVTTTHLTTITNLLKEFVNGPSDDDYVPPAEESPPRDDSTVDDIKDKEKEALGGKSDEEIQQDVSNSLNLDNMKGQVNGTDINENGILAVQSIFNQIFTVMGGAWSTFFILTLTVAFAAFLIGRNY